MDAKCLDDYGNEVNIVAQIYNKRKINEEFNN